MIKDLLLEERDRGTTIIMSTHQMHQVEELCDRIVLIDKGRTVLYGDLHEIQRRFSGREINIRSTSPLPSLEGVEKTQGEDGSQRISLAPGFSPQQILRQLVEKNVPIEGFEVALPSLDEIFIKVVQGEE
jgi:ABC-2 type transport system ATP-binding protein